MKSVTVAKGNAVALQKASPQRKRVVRIVDVLILLYFDALLIFTLIGAPYFNLKEFPSTGLVLVSTGTTIGLMAFLRDWCYDCGLGKAAWVSCKKDWVLLCCAWLIVFYRFTGWAWAVYFNWAIVFFVIVFRVLFQPWFGYGNHTRFVQVRRSF